jgi:prepilin-type N-terminal cleavage/methylation domain-containing protein
MIAMDRNRTKGFTLLELMITIGLVGVLFGLVVPNMAAFMRNNRLTSAANDLLRGTQQARSEAIKRQNGAVVMCATADSEAAASAISCSYGSFSGWFVFNDINNNAQFDNPAETVLARGASNASVTVKTNNNGILCYLPTGFEDVSCGTPAKVKTQKIVLCDARGVTAVGTQSTGRAVLITATGRTRVTNVQADIVATPVLGCPT